jgi:hypothetical protein
MPDHVDHPFYIMSYLTPRCPEGRRLSTVLVPVAVHAGALAGGEVVVAGAVSQMLAMQNGVEKGVSLSG